MEEKCPFYIEIEYKTKIIDETKSLINLK